MTADDLKELAVAHALGVATSDQRATIEAAAAHDLAEADELAGNHDAAAQLAMAIPTERRISNKIRNRILFQVANTPQARPPSASEYPAGFTFHRSTEDEWQETAVPGFRIKPLSINTLKGYQVLLAELAPGTNYPEHDHAGSEDLFVLSGDLATEGRLLGPGDSVHATAGSHHSGLYSATGCVALLVIPVPTH